VTKPFVFDGDELQINYIAWPRGEIRVEILDAKGQTLKGFTLIDCKPLRGDEIDHPVTWQSGLTPGHLAGTPVRLRFHLKHADLFSFRFVQAKKAAR
jgi:hypothetical protein